MAHFTEFRPTFIEVNIVIITTQRVGCARDLICKICYNIETILITFSHAKERFSQYL